MSTRSQVLYADPNSDTGYHDAIVYRHSDGYPNTKHGVLHDLLPLLRKFTKHRGFDPMYGTAHIVAEFIRLQHEWVQEYINESKTRYLAENGKPMPKSEIDLAMDMAYLGHGVEAFTGIFHGDVEYIYIIHEDHVEVRHCSNDFWDNPNLAHTALVKRVQYNGRKYIAKGEPTAQEVAKVGNDTRIGKLLAVLPPNDAEAVKVKIASLVRNKKGK